MRKLDWPDHNTSLRGFRIKTDKNNEFTAGKIDTSVTHFEAPSGCEFYAFRGGKHGGTTSELAVYYRPIQHGE